MAINSNVILCTISTVCNGISWMGLVYKNKHFQDKNHQSIESVLCGFEEAGIMMEEEGN